MAHNIHLTPTRTYATYDNAVRAIETKFPSPAFNNVRYTIVCDANGRFYPMCLGTDAVCAGTHFHFPTVKVA